MGKHGKDGTLQIKLHLRHNIKARPLLRDVNSDQREKWITHFTSQLMDLLNVEEVSNMPEVRQVFPRELAETVGFPVVCWRYDLPVELRVSNERATDLNAHKVQHRQCSCANAK